MTQHISVDIETASTESNGAILSIGAVHVDTIKKQLGSRFYTNVNLQSCVDAGLQINANTFLWWMQQSDAARNAIASPKAQATALKLATALEVFNSFIESLRTSPKEQIIIWSNGANFDGVLIRNAYKAVGLTPHYSFRNEGCYRTLNNMLPLAKLEQAMIINEHVIGTKHNALDDAIYQGERLLKMFEYLSDAERNYYFGSTGHE